MGAPARNRHDAGPRLVLHADDFGMNEAVTRGILQGLERGLLTSASVLTNAPYAAQALAAWKELLQTQRAGELASGEIRRRLDDPQRPFDLGAHLNLTQGRPLTTGRYPTELLDEMGRFPGPGRLFRRLRRSPERYLTEIEAELTAQVEIMLDYGLHPTHINGHQYVEMMPGVSALVPRIVMKYGIAAARAPMERRAWLTSFLPGFRGTNALLALVKRFYAARFCRTLDHFGVAHPDAFFGSSHAGLIDLRLFLKFLQASSRFSLAEVALHPACRSEMNRPAGDPDGWSDPLAEQRPNELELLVSPALAELLLDRRLRLGRIALAA